MTGPRDVLTSTAVGFIQASVSALIRPRVSSEQVDVDRHDSRTAAAAPRAAGRSRRAAPSTSAGSRCEVVVQDRPSRTRAPAARRPGRSGRSRRSRSSRRGRRARAAAAAPTSSTCRRARSGRPRPGAARPPSAGRRRDRRSSRSGRPAYCRPRRRGAAHSATSMLSKPTA